MNKKQYSSGLSILLLAVSILFLNMACQSQAEQVQNDFVLVENLSELKTYTDKNHVKIKLKDLNLNVLGSALGLMGDDGQEIRYLGKIKVSAYGIPFSVKVDYKEKIQLKI